MTVINPKNILVYSILSTPFHTPTIHGLLIINRQHRTFKMIIQEPIFYFNFNFSGSLSNNLSLAPQQTILTRIIEKNLCDWPTLEKFVTTEREEGNVTFTAEQSKGKMLFSRFQGLDQAMGKLSESLLDTRKIEWTYFDQRTNSDEFFKSSLLAWGCIYTIIAPEFTTYVFVSEVL